MDNNDERPWGWMVCHLCGLDCEDESDYDETTRVSTCPACRTQQQLSADEEQADEVFTRR